MAEWVPGYEQALTEAGFGVERVESNGRFRALRVTRGDDVTA